MAATAGCGRRAVVRSRGWSAGSTRGRAAVAGQGRPGRGLGVAAVAEHGRPAAGMQVAKIAPLSPGAKLMPNVGSEPHRPVSLIRTTQQRSRRVRRDTKVLCARMPVSSFMMVGMLSVVAAFEDFRGNLEITGLQESAVVGRQERVRATVARELTVR